MGKQQVWNKLKRERSTKRKYIRHHKVLTRLNRLQAEHIQGLTIFIQHVLINQKVITPNLLNTIIEEYKKDYPKQWDIVRIDKK